MSGRNTRSKSNLNSSTAPQSQKQSTHGQGRGGNPIGCNSHGNKGKRKSRKSHPHSYSTTVNQTQTNQGTNWGPAPGLGGTLSNNNSFEEELHPDNDDYFKDADKVQEHINEDISAQDDEDGGMGTDSQPKRKHPSAEAAVPSKRSKTVADVSLLNAHLRAHNVTHLQRLSPSPTPNPTALNPGPPPVNRSSRPPHSAASSCLATRAQTPTPVNPQSLPGSVGEDQNSENNASAGTEPHTPHFERKPGLHSATPNTQRVLKCAQMKYKIALLVKHPFPEHFQVGTKTIIASECWDDALKECGVQQHIKFTAIVEKVMHSLGCSFRGSMGSKAIALVPIQYSFRMPLSPYDKKVVENLLKDGNLIYPKVHFGPDGEVLRSSLDPAILLREDPPFGHPMLQTIINGFAFEGTPLPPASHAPNKFNPMPLSCIALACTVIHYALRVCLDARDDRKRTEFSKDRYYSVYKDYLEAAQAFAEDNPTTCAIVQRNFWKRGSAPLNLPDITETGIRIQRGLSSESITAHLAALEAPPPVATVNQPQPSTSTIPSMSAPRMGHFPASSVVPAQPTGYPSVPTVYGQPHLGGYYNNPPIPTQPGVVLQGHLESNGAAGNIS